MRNRIQMAPLWLVSMLATVLAFQSAGWLLAWKGMQTEAQTNAQQALYQSGSDLQERIFEKGFFRSIQVEKNEIRLEGQLFDCRILDETGDSLRVALYHDLQEEALLSLLGSVFQSKDAAQGHTAPPMAIWLAQWLGSAFLLPENPALFVHPEPGLEKPGLEVSPFMAQSSPGVFAPPPEA